MTSRPGPLRLADHGLPLIGEPAPRALDDTPQIGTPGPTVRIVDDDVSLRRALSRLLTTLHYRVETFAGTGELLGAAESDGPTCLLLDVRLPGVDGVQLQGALPERGHHGATVIMTGHADVEAAVRAMRAGAIDYLAKPFTADALIVAVRRALTHDATCRALRQEQRELRRRAASLTRRELEVCRLVVTGLLNKQIAARIGTAEKTVKVHRARAMAKLGASSLVQLVRMIDRLSGPPVPDRGT